MADPGLAQLAVAWVRSVGSFRRRLRRRLIV
jgi:hypothetical protein